MTSSAFQSLLTQTVTIVRRASSGRDAYNNPAYTWTDLATHAGRLTQTEATEVAVGEDRVISDWNLYFPDDADIAAHDRVRVDGRTFEVVGEPYRVRSQSAVHHVKARLRHVEV